MNKNYYCLVAGLPDILLEDNKLSISLNEFKQYLYESLDDHDYSLIETYFWRFDNQNILNKLQENNTKFNPLGNLTEKEVDELINLVKGGVLNEFHRFIPGYIEDLISGFKNDDQGTKPQNWENMFITHYFNHVTEVNNIFIKDWYFIERDINNFITANITKKHQLDTEKHLIGDADTNEAFIKSSSRDFGLGNDFPALEELVKALEEQNPLTREKKIDQVKWRLLDDQVFFYYFSIERIFSFMLKLAWVERWTKLDKDSGKNMFNELVNELENSYEIPKDF